MLGNSLTAPLSREFRRRLRNCRHPDSSSKTISLNLMFGSLHSRRMTPRTVYGETSRKQILGDRRDDVKLRTHYTCTCEVGGIVLNVDCLAVVYRNIPRICHREIANNYLDAVQRQFHIIAKIMWFWYLNQESSQNLKVRDRPQLAPFE